MQAANKGVNAATISVIGMFKGRLLSPINNWSNHSGRESPYTIRKRFLMGS